MRISNNVNLDAPDGGCNGQPLSGQIIAIASEQDPQPEEANFDKVVVGLLLRPCARDGGIICPCVVGGLSCCRIGNLDIVDNSQE